MIYLFWILIFILLPTSILWLKFYKELVPYWKIFLVLIVGSLLIFAPWDYICLRAGFWYFEKSKILGWWILGLPFEEWFAAVLAPILFGAITILLKIKEEQNV